MLSIKSARYLGSTFIGHARHKNFLDYFISGLDFLNQSNLLQVSVDGSNVNWVFFKLRNYRAENDMRVL